MSTTRRAWREAKGVMLALLFLPFSYCVCACDPGLYPSVEPVGDTPFRQHVTLTDITSASEPTAGDLFPVHLKTACWGELGELARCIQSCQHWGRKEGIWYYDGPQFCEPACWHLPTDTVVSCGHDCESASDCWLARVDPDLIVYPGEPVPEFLVGPIEALDPYEPAVLFMGWFHVF